MDVSTLRGTYLVIYFIIYCLMDISLNLFALHFLKQMKNCACARNWKRTYIDTFITFSIVTYTIIVLWLAFSPTTFVAFLGKMLPFLALLAILFLFASVSFTVISVDYLSHLNSSRCACAEHSKGKVALMISTLLTIVSYCITVARLLSFGLALFLTRK